MVLFFKYVRKESHRKASFGLQSNAGSQGVLGALIIFIIISVNQPLAIPFQSPTCYLSPCIPLFYCNHCFPSLSLLFRIIIIIPLVKNVFVIFSIKFDCSPHHQAVDGFPSRSYFSEKRSWEEYLVKVAEAPGDNYLGT